MWDWAFFLQQFIFCFRVFEAAFLDKCIKLLRDVSLTLLKHNYIYLLTANNIRNDASRFLIFFVDDSKYVIGNFDKSFVLL